MGLVHAVISWGFFFGFFFLCYPPVLLHLSHSLPPLTIAATLRDCVLRPGGGKAFILPLNATGKGGRGGTPASQWGRLFGIETPPPHSSGPPAASCCLSSFLYSCKVCLHMVLTVTKRFFTGLFDALCFKSQRGRAAGLSADKEMSLFSFLGEANYPGRFNNLSQTLIKKS